MPLKIGINALYLKPGAVGGTEIYLRQLLGALARVDQENAYTVYTNCETGSDLVPGAANFATSPQPIGASFRPGRILYEQTVLPVRASHMDVLLNPGFTAPLAGTRNVTVFHDLQHKRHPEFFRWYDLPFWDVLLWASARRSTRLISVSQATHDDLRKYYQVESDIILHGVDPHYFAIGEGRKQAEKLLLCVSTLHPHKNHVRLIEAFSEFRRVHPEYHLVLAGVRGFAETEVMQVLSNLGLQERVTVTGWIPQEQLYDLYARAAAAVYPSTFEGFGMPVIEAMAAQVPLACSQIEPLHGLVNGCAIEFNPGSIPAIVEALVQVIDDPPPLDRALLRAREFSWEETARRTLAVLETTCQSSRSDD